MCDLWCSQGLAPRAPTALVPRRDRMPSPRLLFLLGFLLRIVLPLVMDRDSLVGRIELSTPDSSYQRLEEGVFLRRSGLSAYDGDLLHHPPLMLYFFEFLQNLPALVVSVIYAASDAVTAVALVRLGRAIPNADVIEQRISAEENARDKLIGEAMSMKAAGRIEFQALTRRIGPSAGGLAFLLNPLSVANCIARSTSCFSNVAVSVAIASAAEGRLHGAEKHMTGRQTASPFRLLASVDVFAGSGVLPVNASDTPFAALSSIDD
ncbi:GPI transamidase subunit PIG-U-domain-containing protein [Hyaloraphidium curvatum]|nr:GPI transamidase subunit PIG-U-domain-containing protein [Hyaloraphidium curvatum]